MLLTFRPESLEKIRQGRKTTTIRRNPDRWVRWYFHPAREHDGRPLQIYEGSPRYGGRLIALSACLNLYTTRGSDLRHQEAVADGFDDVLQLIDRLSDLHGILPLQVLVEEWAVIEFATRPILVTFFEREGAA
ncbi:MAG: hypothetical protein V3U30_02875 [Thermoplasmata archaeon]